VKVVMNIRLKAGRSAFDALRPVYQNKKTPRSSGRGSDNLYIASEMTPRHGCWSAEGRPTQSPAQYGWMRTQPNLRCRWQEGRLGFGLTTGYFFFSTLTSRESAIFGS
jgi:hypothetical protein